MEKVEKDLDVCSLKVIEHHQAKSESEIISTWKTVGSPANQEKFTQLMLKDKDIKEMDY